jgi:hypothetical protein
MSSATTDNSVMQSDELDEVQYNIEQRSIGNEEAVQCIIEFAERKMKLNIDPNTLLEKLNSCEEQIDFEGIKDSLSQIQEVDQQIRVVD